MASNPVPLVQASISSDKLSHTKALLIAIYKENRPKDAAKSESCGSDIIDPVLLTRAINCLSVEQEDELKSILKQSFGSPDDVSFISYPNNSTNCYIGGPTRQSSPGLDA